VWLTTPYFVPDQAHLSLPRRLGEAGARLLSPLL